MRSMRGFIGSISQTNDFNRFEPLTSQSGNDAKVTAFFG